MADAAYHSHYQQSHALVVGIDSYGDPRFIPLGEAEADARALASVLSAPPYNFNTRILLGAQATRRAILDALFELRDTDPDDRILVYFAGHGYTLTNRFGGETGYLAAVDSLPERDFTALELAEVTGLRLHAGAKHIAFVIDACFSGQALGLTRSAMVAADKYLTRRAYQCISAGAGDQPVADYQSMTDILIATLREGNQEGGPLTLSNLGLLLQQTVAADSGQTQIPQFGHLRGSQGGEFIFDFGKRSVVSQGLGAALQSDTWHVRRGAVMALIEMADEDDPERVAFAHRWLDRMAHDEDERVRHLVISFLNRDVIPADDDLIESDTQPIEVADGVRAPVQSRKRIPVEIVETPPPPPTDPADRPPAIPILAEDESDEASSASPALYPTLIGGWIAAFVISGLIFYVLEEQFGVGYDYPYSALIGLAAGAIGGAFTGLALRQMGLIQRRRQITFVTLAWIAGYLLTQVISALYADNLNWQLAEIFYDNGMDTMAAFISDAPVTLLWYGLAGAVSAALTALILRRSHHITRSDVLNLSLGWLIASLAGAALRLPFLLVYISFSWAIEGVLAGLVTGMIGIIILQRWRVRLAA